MLGKRIKRLLFIVGGVLVMIQAIGCIGSSEKKILNKFNDFIIIFQIEKINKFI